jgi:hypothetical protein
MKRIVFLLCDGGVKSAALMDATNGETSNRHGGRKKLPGSRRSGLVALVGGKVMKAERVAVPQIVGPKVYIFTGLALLAVFAVVIYLRVSIGSRRDDIGVAITIGLLAVLLSSFVITSVLSMYRAPFWRRWVVNTCLIGSFLAGGSFQAQNETVPELSWVGVMVLMFVGVGLFATALQGMNYLWVPDLRPKRDNAASDPAA